MLNNKKILLVISGGIAAYKSLELARLFKKAGADVKAILTKGGSQFVTELSLSALTGNKTYTDLWNLDDEQEMGHIQLTRWADCIVIAPASANLLARLANGKAEDLASTTLLASDKPFYFAPAMNVKMWQHETTQNHIEALVARGNILIPPDEGEMACGEWGEGRLPEATQLFQFLENSAFAAKPLTGKTALVTAGPTYEAIDPVRFIGNRSSGKQGMAIAEALHNAGAAVTLILGPVEQALKNRINGQIKIMNVESAAEMLAATLSALPADIAVMAAAVSDWHPENPASQKMKKVEGEDTLTLNLAKTTDILKTLGQSPAKPGLLIGFAAETNDLMANARAKYLSKNCDWIIANGPVFGQNSNTITIISASGEEAVPSASKQAVANIIVERIAEHFCQKGNNNVTSLSPKTKR